MKTNLYAFGLSVLALGILPAGEIEAQELLSLVKTENFSNYGDYYSGKIAVHLTEQIYTYNDKNLLVDVSIWLTNNQGRNLSSQTKYTYNDDGKALTTITEQRDYTTKEMNVQGITECEYNADGKIESMVYQYRDYNSGVLVYSYKYDYTYGSGEAQEMKIFNWSVAENDWIEPAPYNEEEYLLDSWGYDEIDRSGYVEPKYELTYNDDSTISTSTYQNYHKGADKWYYTSRTVNQLNQSGYTVKQVTESWNLYCEKWVPSYMSTFKYNKDNISIQNEYSTWDPIGEVWALNSRTESTYITPKPNNKPLEKEADWGMFPNPSDGEVFIELNEGVETEIRIEVMNKLGQVVFAERINPMEVEHTIDLDFLPNGNYIVRLDDGTSVSSRQVVIQQ